MLILLLLNAGSEKNQRRMDPEGGEGEVEEEKEEGRSEQPTRTSLHSKEGLSAQAEMLMYNGGWRRRYCGDRPWRTTFQESLLAASAETGYWSLGSILRKTHQKTAWLGLLPCCHFRGFFIRCFLCASLCMHKYGQRLGSEDPIGRANKMGPRKVQQG